MSLDNRVPLDYIISLSGNNNYKLLYIGLEYGNENILDELKKVKDDDAFLETWLAYYPENIDIIIPKVSHERLASQILHIKFDKSLYDRFVFQEDFYCYLFRKYPNNIVDMYQKYNKIELIDMALSYDMSFLNYYLSNIKDESLLVNLMIKYSTYPVNIIEKIVDLKAINKLILSNPEIEGVICPEKLKAICNMTYEKSIKSKSSVLDDKLIKMVKYI